MKRFRVALAFALGITALAASGAEAASFTVNFCPNDPDGTCGPNGITAASITVTTVDSTAGDTNDYLITASITGSGANAVGKFIDEIGIQITSAAAPEDYEARPSLVCALPEGNCTAPAVGAPWSVFWDGVGGNEASCTSDTNGGNTFCAQSTGNGPAATGTNVWTFYVDLVAGETITPDSLNLRANFVDSSGKTAGNLSPGTFAVTGSSSGVITGSSSGLVTTVIPEPTTLALLGSGLLVAARKLRRRKTNNLTA